MRTSSSPVTPICSGPSRSFWPTTCWPTSSRCSGIGNASPGGRRPRGCRSAPGPWPAPTTRSTATWSRPNWASRRSLPTPWTPWRRVTPPLPIWPSRRTALLRCPAWPRSWCSGARRSSVWRRCRNRGPRGRASCRRSATRTPPSWCGPRPPGFLARLQGLGGLLKGLPLAYNKDLQEDKLYVFGTKEELDLCLQAMTAMVQGLSVDRQAGARGGRRRLCGGHGRRRLSCRQRASVPRRSPGGRQARGASGGGWTAAGAAPAWTSCEGSARCSTRTSTGWLTSSGWWAAKVSPGGTAPREWRSSWRSPGRWSAGPYCSQ